MALHQETSNFVASQLALRNLAGGQSVETPIATEIGGVVHRVYDVGYNLTYLGDLPTEAHLPPGALGLVIVDHHGPERGERVYLYGTNTGIHYLGSNAVSGEYCRGRENLRAAISASTVGGKIENIAPLFEVEHVKSLSDRIEECFSNVESDDHTKATAKRACEEADSFLNRDIVSANPSFDISDDGSLTLHWKRQNCGVMLVFVGDGTVAYSVKTPETNYSTSIRELPISARMPPELRIAIEHIDMGARFNSASENASLP